MVVVRWFSLVLIVLTIMLLGADIVSTLEMPGALVVRSLDRVLFLVHLDAKPWVEGNFISWLVNPALMVLSSPSWATFGILGVIVSLLSQPGRPKAKPAPPPTAIER